MGFLTTMSFMKKQTYLWIIGLIIAAIIALVILAISRNNPSTKIVNNASIPVTAAAHTIKVVAAEDMWGSLASQIGGSRAQVLSIVSDPNADPHEYESTPNDARAVADANLVIENGIGYDSWMDKLLSAGSNPERLVLNVGNLIGKKEGDNPHVWYSPDYVNSVTLQMERDFTSLDPENAGYYQAQLKTLQASLAVYQGNIALIKQQFGGTKVAATEDIFAYLADASGLDLISPSEFTEAVAEGNDPSAQSIVEFENQLNNKEPAVLVYNQQTVTPLTENIKALAAKNGIAIVPVTETIQPEGTRFEDWMNAEIVALQKALSAVKQAK
jgi:zinc/manganese transport system substrate-binding protein